MSGHIPSDEENGFVCPDCAVVRCEESAVLLETSIHHRMSTSNDLVRFTGKLSVASLRS